MREYYWVKSKGVVEKVSKIVFYYLRNKNIEARVKDDHYMLIEKSGGHLNIMKREFIPDIPIKALKEILNQKIQGK